MQIADALKLLADLHRTRNRRPIADTVNALLEAVRAHAGFTIGQAGTRPWPMFIAFAIWLAPLR